jgi:hypothetical protein
MFLILLQRRWYIPGLRLEINLNKKGAVRAPSKQFL